MASYPLRVAKNYDVYINQNIFSGSAFYASYLLEGCEFSIKFEFSKHSFVNTGGGVNYLLKSYDVNQKFSLVGLEQSQFVNNFVYGDLGTASLTTVNEFDQSYSSTVVNNLSFYLDKFLSSHSNFYYLTSYTLPFIVKMRSNRINQSDFIKTDFDFSLYGSNNSESNVFNYT